MQHSIKIGLWIAAAFAVTNFGQGCKPSVSAGGPSAYSSTGCSTPAGFSGRPQTIEEAIAMINALPKPVTVACFLESLKRPLGVNLTNSVTSAQPAFSTQSPRIFILIDNLTISAVPEGVGSEVIEFGAIDANLNSLKGEIGFPVTTNLAPTAAYDKIRFGSGTVCQFCHQGEFRDLSIAGEAFRSTALRPRDNTVVGLDTLRAAWLACDIKREPDRCAILRGLFGFGEVTTKNFPANLPTMF